MHLFGTWFMPAFGLPSFAGVGGQLRPTWFFSDQNDGGLGRAATARHGVYLAPFFRGERVVGPLTEHDEGNPAAGWGWSGGAFLGYAIPIGGALDVRLGAGLQYLSYDVARDLDGRRRRLRTFFPALDLVVGFAF